MTRVVGLTGGIGTGKSTVSEMLRARGATVIDADAIVHELQAPGTPLLARMVEAFGQEILGADGALDRKRLGDRVFADASLRARLGALVGPAVVAELARRREAACAEGADLVVLDVPLLLEGRPRDGSPARRTAAAHADEVIVVYAPESLQIARQMARDGASREHALARIRAQLPIEENAPSPTT